MNLDPNHIGDTMKSLESLLKLEQITYQQRLAIYTAMLIIDIQLDNKLKE